MTPAAPAELGKEAVQDGSFQRQRYVFTDRITYQRPGFGETVNFDHIKRHYCCTHDQINPTRIVPKGPAVDWLAPYGREGLD